MVFEQLLQSGVCYAYLMRMLGAVLPTHYSVLKKGAPWCSFRCTLYEHMRPITALRKKTPIHLRMCSFCCIFVPEF